MGVAFRARALANLEFASGIFNIFRLSQLHVVDDLYVKGQAVIQPVFLRIFRQIRTRDRNTLLMISLSEPTKVLQL